MNDPGATHFYGDGCDEAHGSWANMGQALDAERALADDVAAVLDKGTIVSSKQRDEVERVLARYREARGR